MDFESFNAVLRSNADRIGHKPAIKELADSITYQDLYNHVKQLSFFFKKKGLQEGDIVAIYLDNSINFIISIFATFSLSCIYVPLPYNDPPKRIKKIIDDCQPKVIITDKNKKVYEAIESDYDGLVVLTDIFDFETEGKYYIDINFHFMADCLRESGESLEEVSSPSSLAYILYTSGSTGNPKGVAIRHESLMNYARETINTFAYDETTKTLCLAPFYFDGSLGSIFCPLVVGGCIVICDYRYIEPIEVLQKLRSEGITHLSCVPSLFKQLVDNLTSVPMSEIRVKTVGIGGEDCPREYFKRFKNMLPHARIFNRYGPTETTVIVSGYEIGNEDIDGEHKIPIGKPHANVDFYAFKEDGELIELGEIGELYVGGIQVMDRYWNDPELTRKTLVDNILPGKTLYKTGDLVSIDDRGNYIFIGRKDDLIKKHGNRIYLSEITNALRKLEFVEDAVCMALEAENEELEIIVFVAMRKTMTDQELKGRLMDMVPLYMNPDRVIQIDELPVNSTGKIDLNRLKRVALEG